MNIRQQIIVDRVEELASVLSIQSDEAFTRLVFSLVTGKSIHSFDPSDLVDGGQDKQIDLFVIDEQDESADVYIIQCKFSNSFSSNALIRLGNGLHWVFQRPRKDLDQLANTALRDKIFEYRALQNSLGPSNIRVFVYFATIGNASKLSDEFKHECKGIIDSYANGTFEEFSLEVLGFDELIQLSRMQERQTRRVDADVKIKYDANNPSLIKYYAQDLQGLVCSVPASEIARLVNDNPDGAVFDLNIRKYLGKRGAVNRDILSTCTDKSLSYEFWFLNNGITIICDKADPVTDPDNPHVKLTNLQIVNGCQTATTIAMAQKNGDLASDVRVLTRIYQTQDPALVDRIVLTTNNQNKISSRDLRANDPVQIDMEAAFAIYGYKYERKPGKYTGKTVDPARLFTNEYVAQAYLAIVLRAPSDARARKYKIWGELHGKIFAGRAVEAYIISALIASRVAEWLRKSTHAKAGNDVERLLAKRGSFHVARAAAYLLRGSDDWSNKDDLKQELEHLEVSPEKLEAVIEPAFDLVLDIIRQSSEYVTDVDRALKSSALDRDISAYLNSARANVSGAVSSTE